MFSFASSSSDGADFICFIGDLRKELNNSCRYVKEIRDNSHTTSTTQPFSTKSWGLFCVSLHSTPTISLCCRAPPSSSTCRFFQLELTKDLLKEHMEEDLELFNDNGLEGFGQLLGKALKETIIDLDNALGSDTEHTFFPLRLTYSIGSNELVGVLKIPLIADNISDKVISFMFDIKESASSNEVTGGSASSGSKRSRGDISSDVSGDRSEISDSVASQQQQPSQGRSEGGGDGTPVVAATAPAKPRQKKRVGGISLNPSMRKKK